MLELIFSKKIFAFFRICYPEAALRSRSFAKENFYCFRKLPSRRFAKPEGRTLRSGSNENLTRSSKQSSGPYCKQNSTQYKREREKERVRRSSFLRTRRDLWHDRVCACAIIIPPERRPFTADRFFSSSAHKSQF